MSQMVIRRVVMVAAVVFGGALARSQELLRTHYGTNSYEAETIVPLDDLTGDGIDDYLFNASLSVSVHSGSSGDLVWRLAAFEFVSSAAQIGDWTGDGVGEVAVGKGGVVNGRGRVDVLDGLTGNVVTSMTGVSTVVGLGMRVADAGDVNGDGIGDLIASAFGSSQPDAWLYLGPNATFYRSHNGSGFFGEPAVDGIGGDIDGDGVDDYIIGWQRHSNLASFGGMAVVFSGLSGAEIYRYDGTGLDDYLGRAVSRAGDVNGDGTPDFWIGMPQGLLGFSGHVFLHSGSDGSVLLDIDNVHNGIPLFATPNQFGNWIVGGNDVNGDGVPDAMVSGLFDITSFSPLDGSGSVSVISGATGQRLWQQFGGPTPLGDEGRLGMEETFSILGDLDGDGYREFAIAYPQADYDILEFSGGRVRIFRGGPGDAFQACTTASNSIGDGALFELPRAVSVTSNSMRLRARRVPAGKTGLFFYGPPRAPVPFGDGELCVGVRTTRILPPVTSAPEEAAWLDLDLESGPYASGPNPLLAGSTWRFQFWYQDPAGPGGSGVNLSDARDVTLTP